MNSQDYIKLEEQYGAHNYHPLDVVIKEAKGVWVTDVDGKKYMDCLAAYSAVNQGHCHPKIYQTFVEQAKLVTLTSRAFRNDKLPLFYKKLHDLTGYDMSLPMNSGAEAVETAIKTARRWAYDVKGVQENKAEIIVATGNFHGRTTTIVGFSDDPHSFKGFGPYCKEAFPMHQYGNLEDLKSKITKNTAAVLIEPIQGEGGIVIPPDGYLKGVEQICKENNILFICDEIQSGLGRAGKLFAHYYENVRPDIVIIGKALSGGFYPVSAILAAKHLSKHLGLTFIDIDLEIEKQTSKSIQQIFNHYGENHFRKIESQILKQILNSEKTIISCGGGIVKNHNNRKLLQKSLVCWLYTDPAKCLERKNFHMNPPLNQFNHDKNLLTIQTEKLFNHRLEQYFATAHNIIINNSDEKTIIERLKNEISKLQ